MFILYNKPQKREEVKYLYGNFEQKRGFNYPDCRSGY